MLKTNALSIYLSLSPQSDSKNKIANDPKDDKECQKRHHIDPKDPLVQGHLLQELVWILEVTIGHGALQWLSVKSINGQHGAFEAIADVGDVG